MQKWLTRRESSGAEVADSGESSAGEMDGSGEDGPV